MSDVDDAIRAARTGNDTSRWPTKLPVRDRVALLLDEDSFVEDGLLADAAGDGLPADGVVTGVGTVEGRPVAVIAHDFSVKAGSWGQLTCEKQVRILERADRDLLPVFYLVDSAGGRLTDQLGPAAAARRASSPCRSHSPDASRRSAACSAHRLRVARTCRRSPTGSGWWQATRRCIWPRPVWLRRSAANARRSRRWVAR